MAAALKRLQQLFQEAIKRPVDQRLDFVEDLDAGSSTREQLRSLLREDIVTGQMETCTRFGHFPKDPLTETEIGNYRIVELISRGGMAKVFRGVQLDGDHKEVAIKILSAETHYEENLSRFQNEIQFLSELRHPAIAKLHEGSVTSFGQPYFVMEFIPGLHIDQFAREQRLTCRQIAELLLQVSHAMTFAHERGIIHRDLKPSNILVTPDGHAFILDFGLARYLSGDSGRTRSTAFLGTPDYMAPEQARGHARQATLATDVHALGAILYKLLLGYPPFRDDNPFNKLTRIQEEIPTPPRQLRPDVPIALETICLKCLAKSPRERYFSARELSEDLEHFIAGRSILARRDTWLSRAWKRSVRHRRTVWTAALLLMVGAGLGLTLSYRAILKSRADALAGRDRTRLALDAMFEQFVNLVKLPGYHREHIQGMEAILRAYEDLAIGGDQKSLLRGVRVRRELSRYYEEIDNRLRKIDLIKENLKILEQEAVLRPGYEVEEELAHHYLAYSGTFSDQNQCMHWRNKSLALYQRLHDQHPDNGHVTGMIADIHLSLAGWELQEQRLPQAEQLLIQAESLIAPFVKDDSTDLQAAIRLQNILTTLSIVAQYQGQMSQAKLRLTQAWNCLAAFADQSPGNLEIRLHRAELLNYLGEFHFAAGELPEALSNFDQFAKELQMLKSAFPDSQRLRHNALAVDASRLEVLLAMNRLQDAKLLYRKIVDSLSQRDPKDTSNIELITIKLCTTYPLQNLHLLPLKSLVTQGQQLMPQSPYLCAAAGMLALWDGNAKESENLLRLALPELKNPPYHLAVESLLARALFQQGRRDEALVHYNAYQPLLKGYPRHPTLQKLHQETEKVLGFSP